MDEVITNINTIGFIFTVIMGAMLFYYPDVMQHSL
jgi:hypothetical protein